MKILPRLITIFCLLLASRAFAFESANQYLNDYLPFIEGKNVGLVVNGGSVVGRQHLVDVLIGHGVKVKKLFALEHGIRGDLDAGETVKDGKDTKTGIPVISLYGKNKKPTKSQLSDIDVVIFDIQDVGVRFFTFITSLGKIMESIGEHNKKLIVLDRPNPNGDYVAGPVLKKENYSFIGAYPIPIVYGLTIGELALMIKGEKWVENTSSLKLKVIKMKNYNRNVLQFPKVKPSPNLPTDLSIRLYPILALFEGTNISIGRGTKRPFEIIGYPDASFGSFSFRPVSLPGFSKYPKHQDKVCYGEDLSYLSHELENIRFSFDYLLKYFKKSKNQGSFFNKSNMFNLLVGDSKVKSIVLKGRKPLANNLEINKFLKLRKKYLIYP